MRGILVVVRLLVMLGASYVLVEGMRMIPESTWQAFVNVGTILSAVFTSCWMLCWVFMKLARGEKICM